MRGGLSRGPGLPKYPRLSNKAPLSLRQLPPLNHLLVPADNIGLKENFNRVLVQVGTLPLLLEVDKVFVPELVLLGLPRITVPTLLGFLTFPVIQ
jgi:hypothetical protein